MSLIPPVLLQKYYSFPYKPDGAVPLVGLLLTALMAFGAAVVIGAVVSFIHQWFYLVLFFPLLMGLGVGWAGRTGLKLGKVRNPLVAGGLGLMAGVLVMLICYYGTYLLALRKEAPDEPMQEFAFSLPFFLKFMDLLATEGVTLGRPGHFGSETNLGYVGSYLYWGAEMLFAGGIALFMMKKSTDEPFCLTCHTWMPGDLLGAVVARKEALQEMMNGGDLPRLVELLKQGNLFGNQVQFTAYACPQCGELSTIEIRLQEITIDSKGRRQPRDIGTWSFTADALPAWKKVFTAFGSAL